MSRRDLWTLRFSESFETNLNFDSDIRPVIGAPSNYDQLNNKPRINGVELIGNKTNADIKIESLTNMELDSILK